MKIALGCILAIVLLGTTGCSAADHDFGSVVAGVEQRYAVHAHRIPLMWLVSLCARAKTHDGVRDIRIAEFDHIGNVDAKELDSMMQSELGAQWQPIVKERSSARSEMSVIFVQPSDSSMRMMIADYENGKLDLVRLDMNGAALAQWMQRPQADDGQFHQEKSSARQTD